MYINTPGVVNSTQSCSGIFVYKVMPSFKGNEDGYVTFEKEKSYLPIS